MRHTVTVLVCLACLIPAGAWATDTQTLKTAHARWLAATGQPLKAIIALPQANASTAPLLTARILIQAGLMDRAGMQLERVPDQSLAVPLWLALAKAYHAAGAPSKSEAALLKIPPLQNPDIARQRGALLARIHMARDEYDLATLALLGSAFKIDLLSPSARYNLGVAFIRSGEVTRGSAVLNELGEYDGADPLHQAVADQANLALGYWFVRNGDGRLARTVLQRIRQQGPLARQGLLGMGWAELAPGASVQRLQQERSPACRGPQPELWDNNATLHAVPRSNCDELELAFEQDRLGGQPARADKVTAYVRAAVAWREASRGGAYLLPVVQEAAVYQALALAEAGDRQAAVEQYRHAIRELENVEDRLSTLSQTVSQGAEQPASSLLARVLAGDDKITTALAHNKRLAAELDRMRQWLTAQRIQSQQLNPAIAHEWLLNTLAQVLKNLRARAAHGQAHAAPDAAQRGLMQWAITTLGQTQPDAVIASSFKPRLDTLRARIERARQRTVNIRAGLQRQALADHRNQTRAYLQQARLGLAVLTEQTNN